MNSHQRGWGQERLLRSLQSEVKNHSSKASVLNKVVSHHVLYLHVLGQQ